MNEEILLSCGRGVWSIYSDETSWATAAEQKWRFRGRARWMLRITFRRKSDGGMKIFAMRLICKEMFMELITPLSWMSFTDDVQDMYVCTVCTHSIKHGCYVGVDVGMLLWIDGKYCWNNVEVHIPYQILRFIKCRNKKISRSIWCLIEHNMRIETTNSVNSRYWWSMSQSPNQWNEKCFMMTIDCRIQ